ncbi:hypothetical protein C8R43DRAFT_982294 [Mycena crocata]|nr:hypothetical protein C8R43DRAFT_982294 [Mycena crocata]
MLLRQSLRCCSALRQTRLYTPPRLLFAGYSRPESTLANPLTVTSAPDGIPPVSILPDKLLYRGPLTRTFKRLKLFSLSSLTLCLTMAPLMFAVETNLPWTARGLLAATAVGTSGISTALIWWAGRSYVTALRLTKVPANDAIEQLEITTLTLRLQPRITKVFDPLFVVPVKRPFAKWELAQFVLLPPDMRNTTSGQEETVAETTDADGRVLGRWVVTWGENGEGNCHEVGTVVRYFNVHEELLPPLRYAESEAGATGASGDKSEGQTEKERPL